MPTDNVFSRMFSGNTAQKKESAFTTLSTSRVALELLSNAPVTKRNEALKISIKNSFTALDESNKNSKTLIAIFKPFQMACQSKNPELASIAIDCLGKLFTYNFWGQYDLEGLREDELNQEYSVKDALDSSLLDEDSSDDVSYNQYLQSLTGTAGMIAFVIHTICTSSTNGDERVELQIIKALQAAISTSDPAYSLHGLVLVKAIRTVFNVFLVSTFSNVQTVAQGSLIQMIQYILNRIPKGIQITIRQQNDASPSTNEELLSLTVKPPLEKTSSAQPIIQTSVELALKDAYQVIALLCKWSVHSFTLPEGTIDLRIQPIRAKLLSLHLISTILSSHSFAFLTPCVGLFKETQGMEDAIFMDALKHNLCLVISRNVTSVIPPVLDVSMEIFSKLLLNLREILKKEMAVLFSEIIFPILEAKKQIAFHQRNLIIKALGRIFSDPKADSGRILVEIYLNYDCDVESGARENIWERLVTTLAKALAQHYEYTPSSTGSLLSLSSTVSSSSGVIPALTTANLINFSRDQVRELYSITGDPNELKKSGLDLIVKGLLKSLVTWCQNRIKKENSVQKNSDTASTDDGEDKKGSSLLSEEIKPTVSDDPTAFENQKNKKKALMEGIKKFNVKPKKGLQFLIENAIITPKTSVEIAKFLLKTDGLNKNMIGEYLGEGELENIEIMHSFVDQMNFKGLKFVEALRFFLQSFRLPGEAQKIDRFMLKFADRFLKDNPEAFSSADTAYVLAYSVIMLNTDLHNQQVKRKMTKPDFLKNNRGIDEGKNLPQELLESIFDEIQRNEIVMKDEQEAAKSKDTTNEKSNQPFTNTIENITLKTEAAFKAKAKKNDYEKNYVSASHYQHVKPMFSLIWMSILTFLSERMQQSEDVETIMLSLQGFKYSAFISGLFELDLERKTFISTLSKFTCLNNLEEMKAKNFETVKALIEIATTEGNTLREDWKEVITCISQLEKLQNSVQNGNMLPELDHTRQKTADKSHQDKRKTGFAVEAAAVASSQGMTILIDKIFTSSVNLSGTTIVFFVRALCDISWQEISSSSTGTQPRMYCLQRLVEISYFNMKRIRVEWSNMWAILGEHFNQVGSFPNPNVGFFAIDKLRQLAMKFLELEELSNFKFQKDFLHPFEEILVHNPDPKIKDMVLACIQQIVQAKNKNLKSGWKTIFSTLSKAAKESQEAIVVLALDIVKTITKTSFDIVLQNGMFSEYIACLVSFCKNNKFAKSSLQSIELIKQAIQKIGELDKKEADEHEEIKPTNQRSIENLHLLLQGAVETPQSPNTATNSDSEANKYKLILPVDDANARYWLSIMYALNEIIMRCDLEVRTRALNYLFEALKSHGKQFSKNFWIHISKFILLPIFDDLRNEREANLNSKEDASVWISTTLIQTLRQLVDLFGDLFDIIGGFMLADLLDLLAICMKQDNETLSRIGATCLQQLIEVNCCKFNLEMWDSITAAFKALLESTTPYSLFFDLTDGQSGENPVTKTGRSLTKRPEKKEFQQLISKCVQHLLVLQTLTDTINTGAPYYPIYKAVTLNHLLIFVDCFESSFLFAKEFNENMELRNALFKMGFMKQLPNLLKQETASVSSLILLLIRMYNDDQEERFAYKQEIEKKVFPLFTEILSTYNSFDPEAKKRNVSSWRPVVVSILEGLVELGDSDLKEHIPLLYNQLIGLLSQDIPSEIRLPLLSILLRIGKSFGIVSPDLSHE